MVTSYQATKSQLSSLTDKWTSEQLITLGSKTLIINNIGWMLMTVASLCLLIAIPFMNDIAPLVIIITGILLSMILITDILGYIILSIGLLKDPDDFSGTNKRAAASFLTWTGIAVLWRIGTILFILGQSSLTSDDKLIVSDLLSVTYIFSCITMLLAAYYLAKTFEVTFLVYALFNIIGGYFAAPMFIMFTDEIYVFIETLMLIVVIFKFLLVPALGIHSFRAVIGDVKFDNDATWQVKGDLANKKDTKITSFSMEKKEVVWEGTNIRPITVTEKKKVFAVIECPKCKFEYPKATIHKNCLYCGKTLPTS